MKCKAIYVLAFFLIAMGSFFGYYMQRINENVHRAPLPPVRMAIEETKEPQSMSVTAAEVSVPPYWVQAVGKHIVIFEGNEKTELCRIAFSAERLYADEKERLMQGIAAQTKEEALMIAEAFVN